MKKYHHVPESIKYDIVYYREYKVCFHLHNKYITLFIHFKKAFDIIHRVKVIRMLRAYRIPERLFDAIEAMYDGRWRQKGRIPHEKC